MFLCLREQLGALLLVGSLCDAPVKGVERGRVVAPVVVGVGKVAQIKRLNMADDG